MKKLLFSLAITASISISAQTGNADKSLVVQPHFSSSGAAPSDRRQLRDTKPTRYGLTRLLRISVKDYRPAGETTCYTGVVAQELAEIFPEAVTEGDRRGEQVTNVWAVDYARLTPLLIKAVQEQQAQIETLRTQLEAIRVAQSTRDATTNELTRQVAELRKTAASR